MVSERRNLAFRRHAEAAFAFLCDEMAYSLVNADDTFLRYESDVVFINVYHGISSYAIRFEIGLRATPDVKYYPEEVVAMSGSVEESDFQGSTPQRVAEYVPRLASLLRRHGSSLLRGDSAEFERLDEVRNRLSTAVTDGYRISLLRERADRAWQHRNYPELIEVLLAIGESMSPAERKKLQYALEKTGRLN